MFSKRKEKGRRLQGGEAGRTKDRVLRSRGTFGGHAGGAGAPRWAHRRPGSGSPPGPLHLTGLFDPDRACGDGSTPRSMAQLNKHDAVVALF